MQKRLKQALDAARAAVQEHRERTGEELPLGFSIPTDAQVETMIAAGGADAALAPFIEHYDGRSQSFELALESALAGYLTEIAQRPAPRRHSH